MSAPFAPAVGAPTVLELFAGIGGLSLGLERAGLRVVGQVEIKPFCRSVLATHWPEVPRHDDVRTAPEWWGARPRPVVDVVAGGFPCQPFSTAGRRRGVADERWGWPWMADVIRLVRPRYVLVENVAALLADRDAFGWLLGDLAALGFDAEWGVFSACAVGAPPHTRERLFLVAYTHRTDGRERLGSRREGRPVQEVDGGSSPWPHPVDGMLEAERGSSRVVDGVPDELEPSRVTALGNAVVPAVGEHFGRLILRDILTTRSAVAA
ncbi:DNA cytosine methyltransferase [Cryptosporangium sp. NPDC051539]|uniref:DNA cytosine methyltransferase n=1 Tax=Cryptosporangium sp. NPDC051539 TaxID=3363962 RepID=UPI0037BB899F